MLTVCPTCSSVVSKDTAETVAERIRALPGDARAMVLFPTPVGGTPLADLVDRLRKRGFRRLLAGEGVVDLEAAEAPGLAEGKVYKEIAEEMGLSASTVRTHLHNVYRKIGAADRAQAVLVARERGWV